MNKTLLRILATGGTFDKTYDPISGRLVLNQSYLKEIITQCRITLPIALEELPLMDSLHMQESDRTHILDCCRKAKENFIVITHGTDTICETAHVLGHAKLKKTIVLTGAMIPYTIRNSDALFNLGVAIGAVQSLPPNVYIGMNGKLFIWDAVHKNRTLGIFE
jgi:L-asparaginase